MGANLSSPKIQQKTRNYADATKAIGDEISWQLKKIVSFKEAPRKAATKVVKKLIALANKDILVAVQAKKLADSNLAEIQEEIKDKKKSLEETSAALQKAASAIHDAAVKSDAISTHSNVSEISQKVDQITHEIESLQITLKQLEQKADDAQTRWQEAIFAEQEAQKPEVQDAERKKAREEALQRAAPNQNDIFQIFDRGLILVNGPETTTILKNLKTKLTSNHPTLYWYIDPPKKNDIYDTVSSADLLSTLDRFIPENKEITLRDIVGYLQDTIETWKIFKPENLAISTVNDWSRNIRPLAGNHHESDELAQLLTAFLDQIAEHAPVQIIIPECLFSTEVLRWLHGLIAPSTESKIRTPIQFVLGMEDQKLTDSQQQIQLLCDEYSAVKALNSVIIYTDSFFDDRADNVKKSSSSFESAERVTRDLDGKTSRETYIYQKKELMRNLKVWEKDDIVSAILTLNENLNAIHKNNDSTSQPNEPHELREVPTQPLDFIKEAFDLQEILFQYKPTQMTKKVVKQALKFIKSEAFRKGTAEQKIQIYARLAPHVEIKKLKKILKAVEKLYPLPEPFGTIQRDSSYIPRHTKIISTLTRAAGLPEGSIADNDALSVFYKTAMDRLALASTSILDLNRVVQLSEKLLQYHLDNFDAQYTFTKNDNGDEIALVKTDVNPTFPIDLLTSAVRVHAAQILAGRNEPVLGRYQNRKDLLAKELIQLQALYKNIKDEKGDAAVVPAATYLKAVLEVVQDIKKEYLDEILKLVKAENGDVASQITLAITAMDLAKYVYRNNVNDWHKELLSIFRLAVRKGGQSFSNDHNSLFAAMGLIFEAESYLSTNPDPNIFGKEYIREAWCVVVEGMSLESVINRINKYLMPDDKIKVSGIKNVYQLYEEKIKSLPQHMQVFMITALQGNDAQAHLLRVRISNALTQKDKINEAEFLAIKLVDEGAWERRYAFRYGLNADMTIAIAAALKKAETGSNSTPLDKYLADAYFGSLLNKFLGFRAKNPGVRAEIKHWDDIEQLKPDQKIVLMALLYLSEGSLACDNFVMENFLVEDITDSNKNDNAIVALALFTAARLSKDSKKQELFSQKAYKIYKEIGALGMCSRMEEFFPSVDEDQDYITKKSEEYKITAAKSLTALADKADIEQDFKNEILLAENLSDKTDKLMKAIVDIRLKKEANPETDFKKKTETDNEKGSAHGSGNGSGVDTGSGVGTGSGAGTGSGTGTGTGTATATATGSGGGESAQDMARPLVRKVAANAKKIKEKTTTTSKTINEHKLSEYIKSTQGKLQLTLATRIIERYISANFLTNCVKEVDLVSIQEDKVYIHAHAKTNSANMRKYSFAKTTNEAGKDNIPCKELKEMPSGQKYIDDPERSKDPAFSSRKKNSEGPAILIKIKTGDKGKDIGIILKLSDQAPDPSSLKREDRALLATLLDLGLTNLSDNDRLDLLPHLVALGYEPEKLQQQFILLDKFENNPKNIKLYGDGLTDAFIGVEQFYCKLLLDELGIMGILKRFEAGEEIIMPDTGNFFDAMPAVSRGKDIAPLPYQGLGGDNSFGSYLHSKDSYQLIFIPFLVGELNRLSGERSPEKDLILRAIFDRLFKDNINDSTRKEALANIEFLAYDNSLKERAKNSLEKFRLKEAKTSNTDNFYSDLEKVRSFNNVVKEMDGLLITHIRDFRADKIAQKDNKRITIAEPHAQMGFAPAIDHRQMSLASSS